MPHFNALENIEQLDTEDDHNCVWQENINEATIEQDDKFYDSKRTEVDQEIEESVPTLPCSINLEGTPTPHDK